MEKGSELNLENLLIMNLLHYAVRNAVNAWIINKQKMNKKIF